MMRTYYYSKFHYPQYQIHEYQQYDETYCITIIHQLFDKIKTLSVKICSSNK